MDGETSPPPLGWEGGPEPRVRTSAPFDVSEVMRKVRLSFRPGEDDTLRASYPSHGIEVTARDVVFSARALPRPSANPLHKAMRAAQRALLTPREIRKQQRSTEGVEVPQATMHLRTVTASRDPDEALGTMPVPEVDDHGAVVLRRGELTERYRNTEGGMEQSWQFDSKPSGAGSLVVKVAVSGLRHATTTEQGLHFTRHDGRAGVLYSVATWIDAHGRQARIYPEFDDGHIILEVPAALVEASTYPAVLDPYISAEYEPAHPVTIVDPDQFYLDFEPKVASGGDRFIVVWTAARASDLLNHWLDDSDVMAAFVSSSGVVLNSYRITPSTNALEEAVSVIGSDEGDFLIRWQDSGDDNMKVLRRNGTKSATFDAGEAAVWAGDRFVTLHWSTNGGWFMRQRDATGALIASYSIAGSVRYLRTLSWNGQHLVGAGSREETDADGHTQSLAGLSFFDLTGQSAGAGNLDLNVPASRVEGSVAYAPDSQRLAFSSASREAEGSPYWTNTPNVLLVEAVTGQVLADERLTAPCNGFCGVRDVDVATDGRDFLVTWQATAGIQGRVWARHFEADPGLAAGPAFAISASPTYQGDWYPSLAYADGAYFAAWERTHEPRGELQEAELRGVRVLPGKLSSELPALRLAGETRSSQQWAPDVTASSTQRAVTWVDDRNGYPAVYANLLDSTDTAKFTYGRPLGVPSANVLEVSDPNVASRGDEFVATWLRATHPPGFPGAGVAFRSLHVRRMAADGSLGPLSTRELELNQEEVTIACTASSCLVSWLEVGAGTTLVKGAHFDGDSLSPTIRILEIPGRAEELRTVAHDQHYNLVWTQDHSAGTDVYGIPYRPRNAEHPEAGLLAENCRAPDITHDSSQALLVCQSSAGRVVQRSLAHALEPLGPLSPVDSTAIGEQRVPRVVHDGQAFLVAWEQRAEAGDWDLWARAYKTGEKAPGLPFALVAEAQTESNLHLAAQDKVVTLAYQRRIGILGVGLRTVTLAPPAPVALSPEGNDTDAIPTFEWEPVGGVTSYRLVVVEKLSPDAPMGEERDRLRFDVPSVESCGADRCAFRLPDTDALPIGAYRWRVRASSAQGLHGEYSAAKSFGVGSLPPAPVLRAPTGENIADEPHFEWDHIPNVTSYQVVLRKRGAGPLVNGRADPQRVAHRQRRRMRAGCAVPAAFPACSRALALSFQGPGPERRGRGPVQRMDGLHLGRAPRAALADFTSYRVAAGLRVSVLHVDAGTRTPSSTS